MKRFFLYFFIFSLDFSVIVDYLVIFCNTSIFCVLCFKAYIFYRAQKIECIRLCHCNESVYFCSEEVLPIYSILLPIYREVDVLPQLIRNMLNLHYDHNKLEVMLVIEENDVETLQLATQLIKPYKNFSIIVVPDSIPKTKAKATNYALQFVTGEYLVIYDADDQPDSDQILKALKLFQNSGEDVVCLQALLNYYNACDNMLTKMFAIEYYEIFNYMLPVLEHFQVLMPLGGSSNHFRSSFIKAHYWDEYNVTEDAEISMRLRLLGYRSKVLFSYTMEESPITIKSWIKQRARWNKGFLQVFFKYHAILNTAANMTLMDYAVFYVCFLSAVLSFFSVCLSICVLVTQCSLYAVEICYINAIFFVISLLWKVQVISKRHGLYWIGWRRFIFPIYVVQQLIPIAKSIVEFICKPSYWDKTQHGLAKGKSYHPNFNVPDKAS